MTARLRIGQYGYGGISGLKTSIAGFDVNDPSGDDNTDQRSFNTQWTDMVPILQTGVVYNIPIRTVGVASVAISGMSTRPFFEVRPYQSASHTFYDEVYSTHDLTSQTTATMVMAYIAPTSLAIAKGNYNLASWDAVYVIFNRESGV